MPPHRPQSLGEILVERGLVTSEQLAAAVQLKEAHGGSLALNLVAAGALDDLTLLAFSQHQLGLEVAAEHELEAIPERVFGLLPRALLLEHGLLPLRMDSQERLFVGVVDAAGADALTEIGFALQRAVLPQLVSLSQLARHLQRLSGQRWRLEPAPLLAQRRAREGLPPLPEEIRALYLQAQEIDRRLEELWEPGAGPPEIRAVLKLVSVANGQVPQEETLELTYRRAPISAPAPDGRPARGKTETRIIAPTRGGNRWYLDPVERGEAQLQRRGPSRQEVEELPSIVIDDALLEPPRPTFTGQPVAIPIGIVPAPAPEEDEDDFILLTPRNIKSGEMVALTHLVSAPDVQELDDGLEVEVVMPQSADADDDELQLDIEVVDDAFQLAEEPEEEDSTERDTLRLAGGVRAAAPAPAPAPTPTPAPAPAPRPMPAPAAQAPPASPLIPDSPLEGMDFPEELEGDGTGSRDTLQIPALVQRSAELDRPVRPVRPVSPEELRTAPPWQLAERPRPAAGIGGTSGDDWLDASFMAILDHVAAVEDTAFDVEVDELEPMDLPLEEIALSAEAAAGAELLRAVEETISSPSERREPQSPGASSDRLRASVVPPGSSEADRAALDRLERARRRRMMVRPDPHTGAAEDPAGTVNGVPGLNASALERWRGASGAAPGEPGPSYAAPRPAGRQFRPVQTTEPSPVPAPAPMPAPAPRAAIAVGRLKPRNPPPPEPAEPVELEEDAPHRATIQGLPTHDLAMLRRAAAAVTAPFTPGELFNLEEPPIEVPRRLSALVSGLEAAEDRDLVGQLVLGYLEDYHQRVVLWSLRGLEASLWMDRGLPAGAPREQPFQIGAISCLMRSAQERGCYLGPPFEGGPEHEDPDTRNGAAIFRAMFGDGVARSAIVTPLSIRGRVIGLIYCDDGADRTVRVDRVALSYLQSYTEDALQRIIILRKRRR